MAKTKDIRAIPLYSIPSSAKGLLSSMLLQLKVIPTDNQERLFRDWRGLCELVNVSFQEKKYIENNSDPVAAILKKLSDDPKVTVGQLLDMLEKLDRFDVYDDLYDDLERNYKSVQTVDVQNAPAPNLTCDDVNGIITTDDIMSRCKKQYDAFILYAEEDRRFANMIIGYLRSNRFEICSLDDVLPGPTTVFAPVAELISKRCQRIILLYSPDFIDSPANTFFRDYAQADSIEKRSNKIIPIVYRKCNLPPHLESYHKLYYNETDMYETQGGPNFWVLLGHAVNVGRMLRLLPPRDVKAITKVEPEGIQSSLSRANIVEMSTSVSCITQHTQLEDIVTTQRSVSVDACRTSTPEEVRSDRNTEQPNVIKSIKKVFKRVSGKKLSFE